MMSGYFRKRSVTWKKVGTQVVGGKRHGNTEIINSLDLSRYQVRKKKDSPTEKMLIKLH